MPGESAHGRPDASVCRRGCARGHEAVRDGRTIQPSWGADEGRTTSSELMRPPFGCCLRAKATGNRPARQPEHRPARRAKQLATRDKRASHSAGKPSPKKIARASQKVIWVYSSVVRTADCKSPGPWFTSGYALLLLASGSPATGRHTCRRQASPAATVQRSSQRGVCPSSQALARAPCLPVHLLSFFGY